MQMGTSYDGAGAFLKLRAGFILIGSGLHCLLSACQVSHGGASARAKSTGVVYSHFNGLRLLPPQRMRVKGDGSFLAISQAPKIPESVQLATGNGFFFGFPLRSSPLGFVEIDPFAAECTQTVAPNEFQTRSATSSPSGWRRRGGAAGRLLARSSGNELPACFLFRVGVLFGGGGGAWGVGWEEGFEAFYG